MHDKKQEMKVGVIVTKHEQTLQTLPQRRSSRGFTLIELLVVLAILTLLAGLIGPQVMKQFDKAKVDTAKFDLDGIKKSLDIYKLDVGRYPSSQEGLNALVTQPSGAARWNGPYLKDASKSLTDPWGNPYGYALANGKIVLTSLGADGAPGGEGFDADIVVSD